MSVFKIMYDGSLFLSSSLTIQTIFYHLGSLVIFPDTLLRYELRVTEVYNPFAFLSLLQYTSHFLYLVSPLIIVFDTLKTFLKEYDYRSSAAIYSRHKRGSASRIFVQISLGLISVCQLYHPELCKVRTPLNLIRICCCFGYSLNERSQAAHKSIERRVKIHANRSRVMLKTRHS